MNSSWKTSRRRAFLPVMRFLIVACALALLGCGVDIGETEPDSVGTIRARTLKLLDEIEKEISEGGLHPTRVRRLRGYVRYLRGRMSFTKTGTPEQVDALQDITEELGDMEEARRARGPGVSSAMIGSLKELLPRIREVLESIPEPDA